MAGFPLCADCRARVRGPARPPLPRRADRAARPAGRGSRCRSSEAVALLREGAILAVKGLGGYHLACDAADEDAVARLRARKLREDKPFAVMTAAPERLADARRGRARRCCARASGRSCSCAGAPERAGRAVGRARHAVARADAARTRRSTTCCSTTSAAPLVMTSGNRSDEPIAFDDDEARERLGGIADAFLAPRPADPPPLRGLGRPRRLPDPPLARLRARRRCRSRSPRARPLLAVGAELKSTFCVARGARRVPLAPPRRPRHRSSRTAPSAPTSSSTSTMLDVAAGDDRARPPPRVPRDEVGARAGRRARRRPAPPRARRGLPRRARRAGPGARARLRRHRATAPTARSGAASCCAATSRRSSGSPGSSRCRSPAARRRSASRGASRRRTSSWPGGRCRSTRWAAVRDEPRASNAPLSSGMGRLFDAVAALLGVRDEVTLRGPGGDRARAARGRRRRAEPYAVALRRRRRARRAPSTTTSPPGGRAPRSPPRSTRPSRPAPPTACAAAAEPADGRPLGRHVPEPAPARLDARAARGARASASSRTASCRRTTAGSATARRPSRRPAPADPGKRCYPRGSTESESGTAPALPNPFVRSV